MFETEMVLWLQSFATEWLTAGMLVVTEMGYTRFCVALAIAITFGLNFRIGFILFQMLLWNELLTDILKNAFALPRPAMVDNAVELLGENTINNTPFTAADGDFFFDLPESEAIEYHRSHSDVGYGLPSGHVSMTTALWIGTAVLIGSRALGVLAAAVVFLTAASRMYLGRHFLADVVAGFALGVLVVLAIRFFFERETAKRLFSGRGGSPTQQLWRAGILPVLVLIPIILLMFWPFLDPRAVGPLVDAAGRMVGANVAFALLVVRGVPATHDDLWCRLRRVAVGLLLFVIAAETVELSLRWFRLEEALWARFFDGSIPPLLYLWGTARITAPRGVEARR